MGNQTDPESIRNKLIVLLDAEMFTEAVAVAQANPTHERWCEFAVFAFVRGGRLDLAMKVIEWAQTVADQNLRKRCLARYAAARYIGALQSREAGSPVLPGDLTENEADGLKDALAVIDPILMVAAGNRRVSSELESEMLQLAIRSYACLGNLGAAERLAKLLLTHKPVPLVLAELVLGGWVSLPDELTAKLRADHPNSIEALILASLIDGDVGGRAQTEFPTLVAMEPRVISADDKELLCKALLQLGQACGRDELAQARSITARLLGDEHAIAFQYDVAQCLRDGDLERAGELLEAKRDENDPTWLQMFAKAQEATGHPETALQYYQKAASLLPHPRLLSVVARLGFAENQNRVAVEALEKQLAIRPDDTISRRNVAIGYARMHHYDRAAANFARLREEGAATQDDNLDYAASLIHCGKARMRYSSMTNCVLWKSRRYRHSLPRRTCSSR